jgi:RND family efflux transporter MFP subunit
VPQNYSAMIMPGMTARFTVPEYPGETFTALLAANAQAVDPTTGTVLVQLQADNAQGRLKPGDYAQVRFDLPATASAIRLPASALIFNDDGTAVAVVGPGNRVSVKPVTILRDYGTSIEIASGVARGDRVIDNPPDALKAGDEVRVAKS